MSEPLNWKAPDRSPAHTEAPAKKTTLEVEVRARYLRGERDDVSLYEVRLVHARTEAEHKAVFVGEGRGGWLRFAIAGVDEGWYRLGVHRLQKDGDGAETRAFRDVRVVGEEDGSKPVERLELLNRTRAWCGFKLQFMQRSLAASRLQIRHPDGVCREHQADAEGEVWLEGFEGEVFLLLGLLEEAGD